MSPTKQGPSLLATQEVGSADHLDIIVSRNDKQQHGVCWAEAREPFQAA